MKPRSVLITGASQGIGAALAQELAGPGVVLGLVARRAEPLQSLQAQLKSSGATVLLYPCDVSDTERMGQICSRFEQIAGGVDWVIANAGIRLRNPATDPDPSQSGQMIAVNLQGVVNTLQPLLAAMVGRGEGSIVAVGSIAGFRGLPGMEVYGATKSAVKSLMDAWRVSLRESGIHVMTACPGWIDTGMTAPNHHPMPFLMSTERAAHLIVTAIRRRRNTYVFPWQMRLAVPLLKIMPDRFLPNYSG
jgi:short-subunit dehydrogenase